MNCNCINEIDKKLKEKNLTLSGFTFLYPTLHAVPTIATEWVDKSKATRGRKNNPPPMLATHCPFCGKPVEAEGTPRESSTVYVRAEFASVALAFVEVRLGRNVVAWQPIDEAPPGADIHVLP